MSDNSTIEWTDATWGPTLGCTRVSSGCDGCYAIRTARIRESNPNPKVAVPFTGLTEYRDGRLDWTGRVNLLPDRLDQPLRWRKPRRIFVDSQSDLFHDAVPDEFIAQVFAVMAAASQHTFQLLSKRHGRMRSLLNRQAFKDEVERQIDELPLRGPALDVRRGRRSHWQGYPWPTPNVHLGVSVEDQRTADLRIPALLDTPAAVRWISAEPLLGPVDLAGPVDRFGGRPRPTYWLTGKPGWGEPHTNEPYKAITRPLMTGPRLDWVVAGGESGPGARPPHPAWFRQLRDQCHAADVPFLFKQWGDWGQLPRGWEIGTHNRNDHGVTVANDGTVYQPGDLAYPDGPRYGEAVRANHGRAQLTAMYRAGKKAAGRELDGVLHDAMPERAR